MSVDAAPPAPPAPKAPVTGVDVALAGFVRALRGAGVPVTTHSTQAFLQAVCEVGADDASGVYWAGRATLCHSPDVRTLYDRVFESWFAGKVPRRGRPNPHQQQRSSAMAPLVDGPSGGERVQEQEELVRADASGAEVLRHRDVAELSGAERIELARLFTGLRVHLPRRPASRRRRCARICRFSGAMAVRAWGTTSTICVASSRSFWG